MSISYLNEVGMKSVETLEGKDVVCVVVSLFCWTSSGVDSFCNQFWF